MQPSEKFSKVIWVARFCSAICGADIVNKDYKTNGITYLVASCITVFITFSAYNLLMKISEDWTVALESFCMIGSAFQGMSKLVSAIIYRKKYSLHSEFLKSVYEEYETKGEDYTLVLNKCVSRVRFALRIVACLYAMVVISLMSLPLLVWTFTGSRILIMQIPIPGLNPDTVLGYVATIVVQSTCLIFGGFGNFAGDTFMLVYFAHSSLLVDIFALKAKELNELAVDFGSRKVVEKLNEVIEWHQTYSNFIEETDMIYFWVNFTQITTSALSVVLTLAIILIGSWPGSYSYIWISFSMMYLYCGMGTLVEIANDRLVDEVYAIHWYILTIPQQKAIRFMLMKSQSPKQVTVGGVVPLSVSTGLQVTKTIYSVLMMLLNFID